MAEFSIYFRTTWMLTAEVPLNVPGIGNIRFLTNEEVNRLSTEIRKRNMFARHSWENNFYLQRIYEFSGRTVIEIIMPGTPNEGHAIAGYRADVIEQLAVLSASFNHTRSKLNKKLGLRNRLAEIDFMIGPDYRYLKSRTKEASNVVGLTIDDGFSRRFHTLKFYSLAEVLSANHNLSARLNKTLQWLFASRIETDINAAVVKTSIALESLLIFSGREPLASSLSERVAYLMSDSPEIRAKLSKIIKRFYDARSKIVHGSKKRSEPLTNLLEATDRICLILCLKIAANIEVWLSEDSLQEWCNRQKWGYPIEETMVKLPFSYLSRAIKLAEAPQ